MLSRYAFVGADHVKARYFSRLPPPGVLVRVAWCEAGSQSRMVSPLNGAVCYHDIKQLDWGAMTEALAALFVRIPVTQARRLDAKAHALGRTKQDLVSGLLAESLEGGSLSQGYVERSSEIPAEEVLTLDELAHFLKLDPEAIMLRVDSGELPGRCFGDQWRFSQHAVLSWLGGSDNHQSMPAGFRPSPQPRPKEDRPLQ